MQHILIQTQRSFWHKTTPSVVQFLIFEIFWFIKKKKKVQRTITNHTDDVDSLYQFLISMTNTYINRNIWDSIISGRVRSDFFYVPHLIQQKPVLHPDYSSSFGVPQTHINYGPLCLGKKLLKTHSVKPEVDPPTSFLFKFPGVRYSRWKTC